MSRGENPVPFPVASDDPLASQHEAVRAWVEDARAKLGEGAYWIDLELKSLPSGANLLAGDPEQSRRMVMAAVAQVQHWDRQADLVRAQAETDMQRMNAHHLPGWGKVWGRRRHSAAVINSLMRRSLPFTKPDLLTLLNWANQSGNLGSYFAPIGSITKALSRFVAANQVDTELREALQQFAACLRSSTDKESKRLATTIEQLYAGEQSDPLPESRPAVPVQARPQPAFAGTAFVLDALKRTLGMLPGSPAPLTTTLEPDRFPLCEESPLRAEHELLSSLFREVVGTHHYHQPDLNRLETGRRLTQLEPIARGRALLAAAERHVNGLLSPSINLEEASGWQSRHTAASVPQSILLNVFFVLDRAGKFDLLLYLSLQSTFQRPAIAEKCDSLIKAVKRDTTASPLTEGERYVLSLYRSSVITGPPLGSPPDDVVMLTEMINDGASFFLAPGEVWSEAVNEAVSGLEAGDRKKWAALFRHALSATVARPSAKWLKTAKQLVDDIGARQVRESLTKWFPLVGKGRSFRKFGSYLGDTRGGSDTMNEENAICLRGLLWCVPMLPDPNELARDVTAVALSAYKKVPGVGPRAVKVGNAAVYALSELASSEAVGQLAMLKVRVKFGTAQKEIEKAFDASATALGLPRDQIEELGVPSYGLEEVGRRIEELGGYRAELLVTGSDAEINWSDANGKQLKAVPAKVKSDHKDDLKELQQSLKDIQSMLPAQRDRIDGLFLLQKSWPIAEWRDRYLDHPLVGTIARRLVWCVDGVPAIFSNGLATDVEGGEIRHGKTSEITLWHPVGCSIEEITRWRRRLETLEITQPFKQAHREIYLLTDAERNTRTYSNRFAAHVIRQHQFNALCAARGWKNKLRLMVDDTYPPPSRELPEWGIRAEFWVESIGEDFGSDTNEAGVYLRLATDQVRFYRSESAINYAHAGGGGYTSMAAGPGQANINEPLPLEEVPALVFSEIMRDVDLFVGVASVGNDPTWQDGGPGGRYRDYWHSFSFGELSGTAVTRRQALERLVPRLKIASQCSFSDRFLVVRGQKRTYKIHLGSGNILMEPNDQYLCIVPDSKARGASGELHLPFEGDSTLSIIISKALLLADDAKIKDPTITRQINVD